MNSLLNMDAFTHTRNNPRTGQAERKWIEYADGMFEPVRKEGNLNNKYHGNKRELDWWTVEKPVDWNPLEDGKQVTLDHDYRRPGTERKTKPETVPLGPFKFEDIGKGRQTLEFRNEDRDKVKPVPAAAKNEQKPGQKDQAAPERPETPANPEEGSGEKKKPAPQTTLLRGAEAYHEFEAALKAEKDASAKEGPQPTPGPSGKLAGADSAPPPKADDSDGKPDSAAAGAGAAGGMVKPKGQHGKGKLTANDPTIKDLINKYGEKREDCKRGAKQEFDELSEQAKQTKSPKERNKLIRRKDAIKGAIKLMDRYFLRMPLLLTPLPADQMQQLSHGTDPDDMVI